MTEEKKHEIEFKEAADYRDLIKNNMNYSIQRIDILIIVLSSSAIALLASVLSDKTASSVTCVKYALVSFVLSIIVNLLSQFVSYSANKRLLKVYDKRVNAMIHSPGVNLNDEDEVRLIERKGNLIEGLNWLSFVLLILGCILSLTHYLY